MLRLYLLCSPKNSSSKSDTYGPGRVGLCLVGPVHHKNVFNFFFNFLKDLELFEGRRGDPYMSANFNFVPFDDS